MKQKSSPILHRSQHMAFLFEVDSLPPFTDLEANIEGAVVVNPIAHSIPESCRFFRLPSPFHKLPC